MATNPPVGPKHPQPDLLLDPLFPPRPATTAAHTLRIQMAHVCFCTAPGPDVPVAPPGHNAPPLPVELALNLRDVASARGRSLERSVHPLTIRLAQRPP